MAIRIPVSCAIAAVLGMGCYTRFATLDRQDVPEQQAQVVVDSTGDTVKVQTRVDTIVTREREVCVWERDLLGYPRLRCYDTYYPREWYHYNNTPWWYINDPYWYDYDRCPRLYYYDPNCGCCKFYRDGYPYSQPQGGSGSSGSGVSPRSRSYGVPSRSSPASTGVPKKVDSIAPSPATPTGPPVGRQRSLGVPEDGTATSQQETSTAPEVTKSAQSDAPATVQETVPAAPSDDRQVAPRMSEPADSSAASPRRRRNPRSW